MADDLSLLLRVRGDASGAQKAAADTRTAIAKLRTQVTSDSKAIATAGQVGAKGTQSLALSLQTVQTSLQSIGGPIGTFSGQIGNAASMLSGFSGEAAGLAGPAGIAVVAIGAMTAVTVGLTKQIFDATVQTAEWQGKLYDLSQQTGVNVETLSALEILAKTTGGSIESITASLGIFQKNLEDAQDPTSKEAKLLKELGVETNNTEQALRQTLTALAAMPTGFQQTSRALELFGRGGKQILAILKEMDGDLDGAIEKFRAMGILIDTQTAKAADKFNDDLAILQFQLRGVVALVGREAMPIILKAVQDVSKALVDNRKVISDWATSIGDAGRGALVLGGYLARLGGIITGLGNIPIPIIFRILGSISGATGILSMLSTLGASTRPAANPRQARIDRFNQLADQAMASGAQPRISGGGGGGGGRQRDTGLQDAIADAKLAEREILQQLKADVEENKRALDEQARDIEEFTRRAIELSDKQLNATIDRINAEIAANEAALRKKQITQAEFARRDRELTLETNEAVAKNDDELWELEQKRSRQIAAAEFAAHERSAKMADEASDRMIRIIQDRVERQIISELEGERQIMPIIEQGYERRKKLLEDELTRITTSLERKAAINDELIRLDGERADAAEQAARRIRDAQDSEQLQRPRRVRDATRPRSVEEEEFGRPLEDELSVWESGLEAMEDRMEDFHDAANTYVVGAFHNMADAATSAIEAWILYGGSLGKALKQALAAELAAISARALVQAALHAAYAIGSLAFGNFAAAGQHAIAAAKFAAVAALTGVAARGLAGNSFQQAAVNSGAVSRGEGGGSGASRSNQPPGVSDVNRRAQPTVQVVVQLHGDIATSALNTRVVNAVVESLDLNDERLTGKIQGAAKRIG